MKNTPCRFCRLFRLRQSHSIQFPAWVLAFALVATLFIPSVAQARVGESPSEIERRLNAAGGVVIRDPDIRENRSRGVPYGSVLEHLPGNVEVRIYYKTADGTRPSSANLNARRQSPGWDVHAVFVNNRAVLMFYKRSQRISDEEFNALMALLRGGGYWSTVSDGDRGESALGYRWERSDGTLRANRIGGDGVLVFDKQMDVKVHELEEKARQEGAPVSVEGF